MFWSSDMLLKHLNLGFVSGFNIRISNFLEGRVAEPADALALGANGEIRGGSSPLPPTN